MGRTGTTPLPPCPARSTLGAVVRRAHGLPPPRAPAVAAGLCPKAAAAPPDSLRPAVCRRAALLALTGHAAAAAAASPRTLLGAAGGGPRSPPRPAGYARALAPHGAEAGGGSGGGRWRWGPFPRSRRDSGAR